MRCSVPVESSIKCGLTQLLPEVACSFSSGGQSIIGIVSTSSALQSAIELRFVPVRWPCTCTKVRNQQHDKPRWNSGGAAGITGERGPEEGVGLKSCRGIDLYLSLWPMGA